MLLTVYVKPSSREETVEKVDETTLKVSVRAKPEKGKANEAVISLLSKEYNVPKSKIVIKRGLTAKIKQIYIEI